MTINRGRIHGMTLGAVALAVGLLAGANPAQAATEVVYGTFLDPNNTRDPRAAAQTQMLEAFERANPDIKVKVHVDPQANSWLRLLKARSASPDVIRLFQMAEPVASGSLESLDALVERDKVDKTDWLLPLDKSRIGGKLYGLLQDYRIPILIYRKSLLEKAGVTPPRTWDEVCATGAKLNQPPVIGYAIPVTDDLSTHFSQFFMTSALTEDGGPYFAADGKIAFAKAAFVRAAQLAKDLYTKCKATSLVGAQQTMNNVHDGLRAGTVAMTTFGLYRFRTIQQQGAGDDLAWAPPPGFKPDGKQMVYGFQLTLNKNSRHKEEAWRLIKYMASPEAEAMAARGGEVVARASAYKDPYFQTPESANQVKWAELIKARGQFVTETPLMLAYEKILAEAMQRMVLKDGTPEAAYEEVTGRYNDALAKAQ